ncbi:hypothetical protein GCM10010211_15360 [Streptomyces albospinus]|uniref:Uncharacterized protein n=1 Tax=Streptomyces albospinus TaxID=285515 RepID=A0ABQ2UVB9_9ACTN|nr:hypothetical protein [Streptomyces albospinus]GGU51589.1 hypothetical protein GCM10010211_15360 [Streptomyces albospinus]
MQINGAGGPPGTVLLLAAAPAGKGRFADASGVIPMLAAVPPAAWAGTTTATLIELADPVDPQAVLTHLRGAAAAEGPLTVVIAGQLQLDRKQRAVHLALARTTPSTVRYTALPWAWLVQELRQRRPGTVTTLYVDLVADADVWQLLGEGQPLALPGGTRVYGVIAPPPPRRRNAQPHYMQAVAQILRAGQRSGPAELHREALRCAEVAEAALVLDAGPAPVNPLVPPGNPAPAAPEVSAVPAPVSPPPAQQAISPVHVPSGAMVPVDDDPHERIAALSKAGRHREAADLAAAAERRAVQTYGETTFAAVHWVEVRAFLALVAQDPRLSCQLWLQAAEARLDVLQQTPTAQDVETAVDGAHHQWMQLRDPVAARALAPQLLALRSRVPGRRRTATESIQKILDRLDSLPGA